MNDIPITTVYMQAMTRLFGARKTTLLFVLRDQTPVVFNLCSIPKYRFTSSIKKKIQHEQI